MEKRLTVLAFSNDTWKVAGCYLAFLELIHGLAKHDNVFLLMRAGATESKKLRLPNETRFSIPHGLDRPAWLHLVYTARMLFAYMVTHWYQVRKAQIVLVISELSSIVFALAAKWFLRKKSVLVVWEIYDLETRPLLFRLYYFLQYSLYRFFDAILVPTAYTVQRVKKLAGKTRIYKVGLIVRRPPKEGIMTKDPRLVGAIGILEPSKHPELVMEAVKSMRDMTGADVRLIWVGEGSLRTSMNKCPFTQFVGDVPDEEKWGLLMKCGVYLTCSESEGFNIPLGEALNAGTPVVAFDLPMYHDVYGDSVVLVRWGDVRAMAEQAIRLLKSPERVDELIRRGRRVMENYAESVVIRRMRRALLEIV